MQHVLKVNGSPIVPCTSPGFGYLHRCLQSRMGSSLRQSENEQEVDCSRQSFPHKCTGTERSLPICTSSSEEPESQNSQFEHGQLNGCRLHQPQRGNPFDGAYSTDSSTVGLVYSQKYLSHRTLCARQDQCLNRPGIKGISRPGSLETRPSSDSSVSVQDRLVINQIDSSTEKKHQLETRSRSIQHNSETVCIGKG